MALTYMRSLPGSGRPCVFRVVRVSGTIRRVEEEVIKRARELVFTLKDAEAKPDALAGMVGSSSAVAAAARRQDPMLVDNVSDGDDGDIGDDDEDGDERGDRAHIPG